MLYVSILTSDRERDPELWATTWNLTAPPTFKILSVYNLAGDKRIFVWEGESAEDLQIMDRLNQVGVLETYPAFDRTVGWQQAVVGDLEGFRKNLVASATSSVAGFTHKSAISDRQIEAAMDLRTRGNRAANPYAARQEAREWIVRQEEQQ